MIREMVLQKIVEKAAGKSCAGILGCHDEVVEKVAFVSASAEGCAEVIQQNGEKWQQMSAEWERDGICIFGLLDLRFWGAEALSGRDLHIMQQTLYRIPEKVVLYFPIHALSEQGLVAYKAVRDGVRYWVTKEEL